MELPIQSRPIQRATASRPYANRGISASSSGDGNTVGQSFNEYGVEPSDWKDVLGTIGSVAGPILGAFGI